MMTMKVMMKVDPARTLRKVSRSEDDETLLSSFDPVIEGSSFQILAQGIDPAEFNREFETDDVTSAPEVISTFNLGDALARVPNKLFFRIGEVAELLEVKAYVLRFWETEFPMVHPTKSRSGQRVYRKKDVEMLLLIKHLLYVERFSIEGARKRIREWKMKPTSAAGKKAAENLAISTAASSAALASGISPPVTAPQLKADVQGLTDLLQQTKSLVNTELTTFFRF